MAHLNKNREDAKVDSETQLKKKSAKKPIKPKADAQKTKKAE